MGIVTHITEDRVYAEWEIQSIFQKVGWVQSGNYKEYDIQSFTNKRTWVYGFESCNMQIEAGKNRVCTLSDGSKLN